MGGLVKPLKYGFTFPPLEGEFGILEGFGEVTADDRGEGSIVVVISSPFGETAAPMASLILRPSRLALSSDPSS